MVEQLVRAARASDYSYIGLQDTASETDYRLLISLDAGRAVILEKPLEAGHHLIRLCDRVLIRVGLVLVREVEDIADRRSALGNYVGREIEVLLVSGEVIESDDRLEDGRGIKTSPALGRAVIRDQVFNFSETY